MKALLIVDGTESSTRAVEEVRRTAWPVGTKFLVLAVAPRFFIPPPPASMLTILSGNWHGWRNPVSRAGVLVHLVVEMLKEGGLEAVGKVRVGRARRQILKEARESFADLILIGSHRISAPRQLLWGGDLASFLVARAPCSVEVIRANHTRDLARTNDRGAARGGPWLLPSRPHGVISG